MLNTIKNPKIQIQNPTSGCSHHWVIESPNGHQSLGTCIFCGATKYFYNSLDEEDPKSKINRVREEDEDTV